MDEVEVVWYLSQKDIDVKKKKKKKKEQMSLLMEDKEEKVVNY